MQYNFHTPKSVAGHDSSKLSKAKSKRKFKGDEEFRSILDERVLKKKDVVVSLKPLVKRCLFNATILDTMLRMGIKVTGGIDPADNDKLHKYVDASARYFELAIRKKPKNTSKAEAGDIVGTLVTYKSYNEEPQERSFEQLLEDLKEDARSQLQFYITRERSKKDSSKEADKKATPESINYIINTWEYGSEDDIYELSLVARDSISRYTNLEIFRVKEDQIPVEQIEFRDCVIKDFQWEPKNSNRFSVIILENEGSAEAYTCILYGINHDLAGISELCRISRFAMKRPNIDDDRHTLSWSPNGTFACLITEGGDNLKMQFLEFPPTKTANGESSVEYVEHNEKSHLRGKSFQWDPSGRYFVSSATIPIQGDTYKYTGDTGFKIWSTLGDMIRDIPKRNFYQLSWRPRPPLLLSADQEKDIRKNLRKYERIFGKIDKEKEREKLLAINKKKAALRRTFRELQERRLEEYYQRCQAKQLYIRDPPETEYYYETTTTEVIEEEIVEEIVTGGSL